MSVVWEERGKTGTLGSPWESKTQPTDRQLLSKAERLKSAKLSSHFNVAVFPAKVFGGKSNILLHYFPISGIFPAGLSNGVFFKSSETLLYCHLPWWPDILDNNSGTKTCVAQGHHPATSLCTWEMVETQTSQPSHTKRPTSRQTASQPHWYLFSTC